MQWSRTLRLLGVGFIFLISVISILMGANSDEFDHGNYFKYYLEIGNSFESRFYDFRMKQHIHEFESSDEVVLINIDDESLQKINSWPIPRDNWAKLLKNLKGFNAKVVAFDIIFPEPVKVCGEVSPDDLFANAIEDFQSVEGHRVIMAYSVQDPQTGTETFSEIPGELYNNIVDSQSSNEDVSFDPRIIEKHTWPIQTLLAPEPDLGYLNMEADADGVFRRYNLVANIDGIFFPSLGMRAYMSYKVPDKQLQVDNLGYGTLNIGENTLFLGRRADTKIRWIGSEHNFKSIPLHKVLFADPNDSKIKKLLSGKILFIGSTATAAHDLRNTPVDSIMPGVYAHMNMVHMLLNDHTFKPSQDSILLSVYILIGAMLILLITMMLNRAILDICLLMALTGGIYFYDYRFMINEGYELRLFFTFFSLISSYSWITFLNFNQANSEKKYIKGAFSRFVAPAIVDDMISNPEKLKVGGERKDITVMFSDVRDFTTISEKLTAVELSKTLNRYMGEMTDVVFETNGTLDKYIGDAIVAFWGAPIDIGDHVNQAMDAAVKMLEALPAINKEFIEQGFPEYKIGLGLNSGECSVGNMGSDQIFAYTALGDNMNLGARLESLCKHYGAQILVSEYTFERMDQEKYQSRLIDRVKVKGKTEPVGVYEVMYNYHPLVINPECFKIFKDGYQLFLDKKFQESIAQFNKVLEVIPTDKASLRLKASAEHWIETPPTEDDDHTITTMTTK